MIRTIGILLAASVVTAPIASAQIPHARGISVELRTDELLVPLQMAEDAEGTIYFGSGWLDPVTDDKVHIHFVRTDDTSDVLPNLVRDPDSLALGPDGALYSGAWGGQIYRTDPSDGSVVTWLKNSGLKNIDGLHFFGNTLYSVAFDSAKIHCIDFTNKAVAELADLSGLGITGLTGIVRHPVRDELFVSAPKSGKILHLDTEGNVLDADFATGFEFPGHLAFDPTDPDPATVFLADNGGGAIYAIDLVSGTVTTLVNRFDQTGGLLVDAEGRIQFSSSLDDGSRGELWRIRPFTLQLDGSPAMPPVRAPVAALLTSPADSGRHFRLLCSSDDQGKVLPSGRELPIGPTPLITVATGPANAEGHAEFDLSNFVHDPAARGRTLHFCAVSFDPERPRQKLGITERISLTVPANRPPIAVAGSDVTVKVGEPVTFDGSASSDADHDRLRFRWTFDDGSGAGHGAQVTRRFTQVGTVTVTLTVSDGLDEAADELIVTVTP